MAVTITSVEPTTAKLTDGVQTEIRYGSYSLERSKTYTENLYIPQKRYIQVTLKGFVPQQQEGYYDHFEVDVAFPDGGYAAEHQIFVTEDSPKSLIYEY